MARMVYGSGAWRPDPMVGARDLLLAPVRNPRGEYVGRVTDVMVDLQSGAVAYLVLTLPRRGGAVHAKRISVPWTSFDFEPERDEGRLRAELTLEALWQCPGIEDEAASSDDGGG